MPIATTFGAASSRGYGEFSKVIMFTTWNPSDKNANITLSNGNLTASATGGSVHYGVRTVVSKTSGKWYWEYKADAKSGNIYVTIGVMTASGDLAQQVGADIFGWGEGSGATSPSVSPSFWHNGTSVGGVGVPVNCTTGDFLNVAYDATGGNIWYGKNGTWMSGDPSLGTLPSWSGISGTLFGAISIFSSSGTGTFTANFGATAFNNSVPTGFTSGLSS